MSAECLLFGEMVRKIPSPFMTRDPKMQWFIFRRICCVPAKCFVSDP